MSGPDVYAGTFSLSVRMPRLTVSLLLTVQASWRNRPMLLVLTSPSVMKPCFGYHAVAAHRVVAVGAAAESREGRAPADRDEVALLAGQDVVADAVELHAALDRVLAARVHVQRRIHLEVDAGLLVPRGCRVGREVWRTRCGCWYAAGTATPLRPTRPMLVCREHRRADRSARRRRRSREK